MKPGAEGAGEVDGVDGPGEARQHHPWGGLGCQQRAQPPGQAGDGVLGALGDVWRDAAEALGVFLKLLLQQHAGAQHLGRLTGRGRRVGEGVHRGQHLAPCVGVVLGHGGAAHHGRAPWQDGPRKELEPKPKGRSVGAHSLLRGDGGLRRGRALQRAR